MIANLDIADNIIIAIYFIIVLVIGLYYSRNSHHSAESYFLANRNMGWITIGFSIFATNISSEHLIGLATSGAKTGIAVGHFEWFAIFFIIMLGWIFAPIILKDRINTMPELIGKKFGPQVRKIYSGLSIFTYIFTKITIALLAGGILLNSIFGWDFLTSVTLMILFTGIYTIIGGLRSVMYTQIFQAIVFIIGGILVVVYGINGVGGVDKFIANIPASHFELFKPLSDPDFPWLGILLGAPILAAWYWWADQYIVQRIMAAKNLTQARKGTYFAAGLKFFPFLFLIIPGMIALQISVTQPGNGIYEVLFTSGLFPIGIKGIIISGFFAALMSSLASAFNSTATLIAYDFFNASETKKSDEQLILIGRLSTIFIVIVAIAAFPLLNQLNSSIYVNLQKLQAYISPPILVVFIMGVFGKRKLRKSAFWTLIIGEGIGIIRIALDILNNNSVSNIGVLKFIADINYLYFAPALFVLSFAVFLMCSYVWGESYEDSIYKEKKYRLN